MVAVTREVDDEEEEDDTLQTQRWTHKPASPSHTATCNAHQCTPRTAIPHRASTHGNQQDALGLSEAYPTPPASEEHRRPSEGEERGRPRMPAHPTRQHEPQAQHSPRTGPAQRRAITTTPAPATSRQRTTDPTVAPHDPTTPRRQPTCKLTAHPSPTCTSRDTTHTPCDYRHTTSPRRRKARLHAQLATDPNRGPVRSALDAHLCMQVSRYRAHQFLREDYQRHYAIFCVLHLFHPL